LNRWWYLPRYDLIEAAVSARFDSLNSEYIPVKEGYDFLRALKADVDLTYIPFLFLSSTRGGKHHDNRALALGAQGFTTRPIEPRGTGTRTHNAVHTKTIHVE
jgi:CheY-like chemotaxis protein